MIGLDEQLELFKMIGDEVRGKSECFVIGGSAMLFHGLKNATKDVDLVFLSRSEREKIINILEESGFYKRHFPDKDIFLMERGSARLDLFLEKVISFSVSPGIIERVKQIHEFGNFIAKVVSLEDIILLKCATDREGDRLDAREIIQKFDIKWDIIKQEILWQNKNSGKGLSLFLYDFLVDLKEMGIKIPAGFFKELKSINSEFLYQKR